MQNIENTLGEKIKTARLAKGYTQEELGKLIGVQKSAIAKYEKGRVTNIRRSVWAKLCEVLDMQPEDFINDIKYAEKKVKDMNIGNKIRERRMALNMSQRELSDKMGYSNHSTITRIEAGEVDIPQSKLAKLADVLQTTPAYLMGCDELTDEQLGKNDIIVDIVRRMRKLDTEQLAELKSFVESLK